MASPLASLALIALSAAAANAPPQPLHTFQSIDLKSPPAALALLLGTAVKDTDARQQHDFSNGFGIARQTFAASLAGAQGQAYALYGRKTGGLVGISWQSGSKQACQSVAAALKRLLGKPTDVSAPHSATTWEDRVPGLEVTLTTHEQSCSVGFLAEDPWDY